MNMKKVFLASTFSTALILSGCGGSSSDTATNVVNNATASISGTITDDSAIGGPAPLSGVKVECIYTGSLPCSSDTTDAGGNYSVTLLKNTGFYLRASLNPYITINSAVMSISADDTGNDIGLVNAGDAVDLVNFAFSSTTLTLGSAAWLVVDVVDASGNRLSGKVINESIGAGAGNAVYPDCTTAQPASPVATATTSCTPGSDNAPAYMAKYSAPGEVTVTALGQTQRGFLVTGEVLYMEFSQ